MTGKGVCCQKGHRSEAKNAEGVEQIMFFLLLDDYG